LQTEDVAQLTVIALRPKGAFAVCGNQPGIQAQRSVRTAHAAAQQIANAELTADSARRRRAVLVGKSGIARHDQKPGDLRQIRNQVFGDAAREVGLIGIGRVVLEGQNGNGRDVLLRRRCLLRQVPEHPRGAEGDRDQESQCAEHRWQQPSGRQPFA
jgi:hypothetical protein